MMDHAANEHAGYDAGRARAHLLGTFIRRLRFRLRFRCLLLRRHLARTRTRTRARARVERRDAVSRSPDETDVVVLKPSSVRSGVDARPFRRRPPRRPTLDARVLHFVCAKQSYDSVHLRRRETCIRGSHVLSHVLSHVPVRLVRRGVREPSVRSPDHLAHAPPTSSSFPHLLQNRRALRLFRRRDYGRRRRVARRVEVARVTHVRRVHDVEEYRAESQDDPREDARDDSEEDGVVFGAILRGGSDAALGADERSVRRRDERDGGGDDAPQSHHTP